MMQTTVRVEEPVHCHVCRHRMSASNIISVQCDYEEPAVVCRFRCPRCGSAFTVEPCGRTEDQAGGPPAEEVNGDLGRFRELMSKVPAALPEQPPPSDMKGD